MIIKLATEDFEATLNRKEKSKYKAIKAGASIGGLGMAGKNLVSFHKELKPDVGRVKRFLVKNNIVIPKSHELITKRVLNPGKALKAGAIGVLAGGLVGLGMHEAKERIKKFSKKHA